MPGVQKPGIDWPAIRDCWEAGQSETSLAKRFNVTRQAIAWRRDRHHWQRRPDAEAIAATDTAARISRPEGERDRALLALDAKRTPAVMARVLDALRGGASRRLAARMNGLTPDALRAWIDADPEFNRLAEAAVAQFAGAALEDVRRAGAKGDWRASMALLQAHPETRMDYGDRPDLPPGYAGVAVHVVLPPALAALLQPAAPTPPTIEHAADTASEGNDA